MAWFYANARAYLLAVMAGDLGRVRAVIRKSPALLDDDRTLLAPVYFRRPEIFQYISARVTKALERGRISNTALYVLVHWFGETGMVDLEQDVVSLLHHRSPSMRYIALNVLSLHWDMRKWRHEYERLLLGDRDSDVRRMAVCSLGYVLRETRDRRATRVLARTIRNRSEDFSVRQTAYGALRDLWFPVKQRTREDVQYALELQDQHFADPKAWEQWVDWDLVVAIERGRLPGRPRVPADQRRRGYYSEERSYLLAVRAGDLARVKAVIKRYPALLNDDATLFAPVYFQQSEIGQFMAARLMRGFENTRLGGPSLGRLIDWFGSTRLRVLEPDIVGFLSHRNPDVRREALWTLSVSWAMRKYRVVYERMLAEDGDAGVRRTAASGLGYVLRGSRDRRATRLLAKTLRAKNEVCPVRHDAYESLHEIWLPRALRNRKVYLSMNALRSKSYDDPQAWEQGVDWGLVTAIERGRVPGRPTATSGRRRRAARRRAG